MVGQHESAFLFFDFPRFQNYSSVMSGLRRSSRKTAPAQHIPLTAAKRSRRGSRLAEVNASPVASNSQLVQLPQNVLDTLVQQVADVVSQRLASGSIASSTPMPQSQPSQSMSSATSLVEAPLVQPQAAQSAASLPSSPVDTVITNALASAQSAVAGISQVGSEVVTQAVPSAIFSSPSLAIDSRVSEKIKGKIWNNEYFDISLLLSNPVLEDKFQLTFQNQEGNKAPSLCLEPVSKSKKNLSIESWINCFHVFVGVYCRKYPGESPALMKYGEVVQDLAARGNNWRFYDENFRFMRQSQPELFPWGTTHWELWIRSQQLAPAKFPSQASLNKFRPDKPPNGYCFRFSKGVDCSGCSYKHRCFKCEGSHAAKNCNFRGQSKASRPSNQAAKPLSTTSNSK